MYSAASCDVALYGHDQSYDDGGASSQACSSDGVCVELVLGDDGAPCGFDGPGTSVDHFCQPYLACVSNRCVPRPEAFGARVGEPCDPDTRVPSTPDARLCAPLLGCRGGTCVPGDAAAKLCVREQ
jgi:hypothetical protein